MIEHNRHEFIGALRTALMQLDDLPALRQNPLLPILSHGPGEATPSALQRTLLTLIDELRDETDMASLKMTVVPAHDVLYYRYVEQLAQTDLAFQLGVSVRQLRRYQNSAIERLADLLCLRHAITLVDTAPESASHSKPESEPDDFAPHLRDEVASLQRGDSAALCDLHRELDRALAEAGVIAEHYGIAVERLLPPDLPRVAASPTLMRHVLITLLTAVLPHVRSLCVHAEARAQTISLTLDGTGLPDSSHPRDLSRDHSHDLRHAIDAATHLLAHCGGQVKTIDLAVPRIELTIPALLPHEAGGKAEPAALLPATLLVVDDNHDTRYLFRRYAAQTRYTLLDTDDVAQVIPLARRHAPDAILLDVMMPAADGRELLAQLRHHPATQNIPIIMCTILPQQDLAYHLGVAGFMQKPIGRAAFLATLDRVLGSPAQTPNPQP